jgi:hypothetical protein
VQNEGRAQSQGGLRDRIWEKGSDQSADLEGEVFGGSKMEKEEGLVCGSGCKVPCP